MAGLLKEYLMEFRGQRIKFSTSDMGFFQAITEALDEGRVWLVTDRGLKLVWKDGVNLPQ